MHLPIPKASPNAIIIIASLNFNCSLMLYLAICIRSATLFAKWLLHVITLDVHVMDTSPYTVTYIVRYVQFSLF